VTTVLFALALALLLTAERLWRLAAVARFFRRPDPPDADPPRLVSILQPILSGDPTLESCLAENLRMRTRHQIEFVWLIDEDDAEAAHICEFLMAAHPAADVILLGTPPPPDGASPKMCKLIAGARAARGDVLCCLDDDTVLPDFGLERCLPHLSRPGVGVAFGLPYYRHFGNLWSAAVSCFVNATSLLTYVPYTALIEPFTINGMFFAVRRDVLEAVGGFEGLEHTLADDFALARRFRGAGYTLAQTRLVHGIRTHVRDAAHYRALLHRWFTFPRESLLRHLSAREKSMLLAMGLVANVLPLALLAGVVLRPSPAAVATAATYLVVAQVGTAWVNRRYLGGATPAWALWGLTPAVLLAFPLQMLAALLAPRQTIIWRGHVMAPERGGGFRFIRRRRTDGARVQ